MTSIHAKTSNRRNIVFIVYDDIVLLDLVGPLQVFTHARKDAKSGPAYQAHDIRQLSDGGQNSWWNLSPARGARDHQGTIHGSGGILGQIREFFRDTFG